MIEPARAAFLLIDMQNGFIDAASPLCIAGAAATVPACAHALAAAREAGVVPYEREVRVKTNFYKPEADPNVQGEG